MSFLIAASLPLFVGCVTNRSGTSDAASINGVATLPENPPPPQSEAMPAAPGALTLWLWIPGSYDWRGQWVWSAGRWAPRPHPHAIWVAGQWDHRKSGYVWVSGHWR